MGKFDRVLFVSDFDHTLSDLHDRVPPENLEAIRCFMAEGGIFTIASGRSVPTLRPKAALVPTNAPCIVCNGAACCDYTSGVISDICALPEAVFPLIAALRERFPEERVELQTDTAHYVWGEDPNRDAYLRASGTPFRRDMPPQPWLKIAVYGRFHRPMFEGVGEATAEELARIGEIEAFARAWGEGLCNAVRSGPRIVEIFSTRCSKGAAARALARRLGRPILACAGDAPNDITMLRAADFAFCPGDAEEQMLALPGVIPVAPCGGAAVADALRRLKTLL